MTESALELFIDTQAATPVATIAALPAANSGNRGLIRFVTAENEPYYSNGTTWSSIAQGAQGNPGPAGAGVPAGGSALQVVRKNSVGTTTEWATPTKAMVGLTNVDNTSDLDKPISSATSTALSGKADKAEVTASLNLKADNEDVATSLQGKANLVGGKVPLSELPADALVTDTNVAATVNGAQTGAAIDQRITTQATPLVQPIVADYIASSQVVVDAAAAAVDANPTIAELQTGKSNVGHTHTQVEGGPGTVRVNSSGGMQHLVNGAVVTEFNSLGELVKGKVKTLSQTETPALLTLSSAGQLQFWNAAGQRVMTFNDSGVMSVGTVESIKQALSSASLRFDSAGQLQYRNASGALAVNFSNAGEMTDGTVPWANVTGAPTTTAWSSLTGIPEGLNVSDTDGPLGPLTALLSHANARTVPLFFIGSSTTGRVAYPTGVTKRLAAAYPSGGAEYGTVYARNPLTATHTGPGVAGYNGGIGGTTSANYLTTDVLNNIALTQPIAVFHGIGSNDWANNVNPATFETKVRAAISSIDAVITKPHVHILMQQHTRPGTRTYAWDEYSAAMRRIADDAGDRVFIDLGPAINTTDPFGEDPFGFGEGDGTHLNAEGEDVLGELMARALGVPGGTGRRGYTIDQSAGRVVKIWDYLNNREQVIYNDSGARNVTDIASFITSGQVFLRIKAGWCSLSFQDVAFDSEGTILNIFPSTGSPLESVSPVAAMGQGFLVPSNGGQAYRLSAMPGGRVAAYGGVPNGLPMSGSVMWPMDRPMPSVLPGIATGSVPA